MDSPKEGGTTDGPILFMLLLAVPIGDLKLCEMNEDKDWLFLGERRAWGREGGGSVGLYDYGGWMRRAMVMIFLMSCMLLS